MAYNIQIYANQRLTTNTIFIHQGHCLKLNNWHEIFKIMKNKELQPRLLYPTSLSFEIDGQERAKGVHCQQTSISRNVKGSSLEEEGKYRGT